MVHAAFLDWVRSAAPDVANWLHEGNKRRLFTCSSLQFPLPLGRMREAQRKNVHLPLFPDKIYTVRVTLLMGELFPLLYHALLDFNVHGLTAPREPFMRLGKQSFHLQEVVMTDDTTGWCGSHSFASLVEQVKERPLGNTASLTLEFASLTTFNRSNLQNKIYGKYYALLPLPQYIFPMLAARWRELAPPELAQLVQVEQIERYMQDDGIVIGDYDLRPHYVTFTNHPQKGFVGTCTYYLRGPDEPVDTPLTVRQQFLLLAHFAFYSGVGYKTAMGLGQTRVQEGHAHA
jgi:CRISPR-associated endoribonuclease Cas6